MRITNPVSQEITSDPTITVVEQTCMRALTEVVLLVPIETWPANLDGNKATDQLCRAVTIDEYESVQPQWVNSKLCRALWPHGCEQNSAYAQLRSACLERKTP